MDDQDEKQSNCYIIPEEMVNEMFDRGIKWRKLIRKAAEAVGDEVCMKIYIISWISFTII